MSSDDDDLVALAAAHVVLTCGEYLRRKLKTRKRRWWMKRKRYSGSDKLQDPRRVPSGKFENILRMSSGDFEYLLTRVGPLIARQDTNMRQSVPIQDRLAVALRYLASGDSFKSLSNLFKISPQTVSRCVQDVCQALSKVLQGEIKLPTTETKWLEIAEQYERLWDFPNCIGSVDGKRVRIQSPINSGTDFFNDEGTNSVLIFALIDARYCFTYADVCCQGRISGGGVFNNSILCSKLEKRELIFPPDRLPSSSFTEKLPFVFLADSSFTLDEHTLNPYPGDPDKGTKQRIFNYRLSRGRSVVENVFGIMSLVFRVLRRPLLLEPEKATFVTLACVLLHNFLRRSPESTKSYTPPGTFDTDVNGESVPGTWRNDQVGITSITPVRRAEKKPGENAKAIRDSYAEYFVTSGKVSWQDKYCKM